MARATSCASEHVQDPVNVLLITLDQFRGDCLSVAGHPVVRTPQLDRLAAGGVRLTHHYSQAAPCAPGRACLYTGTYQLNNRVVANGTPLDHRFDNVARVARRAGYRPVLFGYADQSIDPRHTNGPDDPRLSNYQGVPPGFDVELELLDEQVAWRAWLETLGYGTFPHGDAALASEPDRPDHHGVSAFLTDRLIEWLDRQDSPWFAHASYWRPHPPYAAAGRWARAYDPAGVPAPVPPGTGGHPSFGHVEPEAAPPDVAGLRSQYFGMISDVDHQLGRLWDALAERGMWDDTVIIVTSDHGELLGDHGLVGKGGFFEESYRVLGIVRDPRSPACHGTTVEAFTENVDILRCHRPAHPCPVRRAPAHPVPRGPVAAMVARRRPLGVRLAMGARRSGTGVAVGPAPRTPAPRRAAFRDGGVRAVRQRRLALLRPGRRPDVADAGHRSHRRAEPRPGHVDLAIRAR